MTTVTYKVPNISCNHCVHTIVNELTELPGVKNVDGDVETKMVKVNYETPATEDKIEEILAEINYPVAK
jgi:copper chaperone